MPRQKYKLNTESLDFEVIKIPLRRKTQRFFVMFLLSLGLFFIYAEIYSQFFESPKIMLLKSKTVNVRLKYDLLLKDIENADKFVTEINNRDQNVYRSIFGLDKISYTEIRKNSDTERTDLLQSFSKVVTKLNDFRYKVYIQLKSFEVIAHSASDMDKMVSCMPAIPPLDLLKMRSFGRFGMRDDPFTGEPRKHSGCDFSVDTGTPIYSTGDGKVVEAHFSPSYGYVIDIDHGFGYLTRYAHLSKMLVQKGDKIKRGEEIALSGNTGNRSKGPHLHYEVRFKNDPKNPEKFFVRTKSDVNYSELINKVKQDDYMEIR
jgi:murein DD-endopeptidase MepM/ murein hydrolase activator NlpD